MDWMLTAVARPLSLLSHFSYIPTLGVPSAWYHARRRGDAKRMGNEPNAPPRGAARNLLL